MLKKIARDQMQKLFAAFAAVGKLYLPVDGEGGAAYKEWREGVEMSGALNTNRSAKDFFFPQTENLVDFKVEGKKIEVVDTRSENEDFTLFGVRACDAASFGILDKVFLSDPVDSYYKSRREHGTIVTLACSQPEETCFCSAFGIDAAEPGGDATAWMDEQTLYLRANTKKGEALLKCAERLLLDAQDGEIASSQDQTREIIKKLPIGDLCLDSFDPDKLLEIFNSDQWPQLSEACLGCGTCTFVCPTCQCYDIRDFDTGHGIKRFRCWDSCMYSDFTKMAHGNPRLTQVERFRQRFMHKLVYFPANNDGQFGCVGCGRCLAKCPISMNIVKVAKAIGGQANE